jgi:Protein of unknown function (DUF559)
MYRGPSVDNATCLLPSVNTESQGGDSHGCSLVPTYRQASVVLAAVKDGLEAPNEHAQHVEEAIGNLRSVGGFSLTCHVPGSIADRPRSPLSILNREVVIRTLDRRGAGRNSLLGEMRKGRITRNASTLPSRAQLIVEVDGVTHVSAAAVFRDAERTRILESLGFLIVRITNVGLRHVESVNAVPPHPPLRGDLSPAGRRGRVAAKRRVRGPHSRIQRVADHFQHAVESGDRGQRPRDDSGLLRGAYHRARQRRGRWRRSN